VTRGTDYYEQAFAPLRQGDLELGAPSTDQQRVTSNESLLEGPVPFTHSEAHRHACEVRYVQNLTPDARETFLQHVAQKRGEEAAGRLREDVAK